MKKRLTIKRNLPEFLTEHTVGDKEETPAVKLLRSLLGSGYENGASDIHIEPRENKLVIRMRVDGLLTEYMSVEKEMHQPLITCAKILCGMDIAEKRLPQDGYCKTMIDDVELNIRTSSVPTIH